MEGLPNPCLPCFQAGLVTLLCLGLYGLFDHWLEVCNNSSDVRCTFVLEFMDGVFEDPGMVRQDMVFHFIHLDKFNDSLPMSSISLGFIVLAMLIMIAKFPQVQPLIEDGGDDGGNPGVAVLLIGSLGAEVLLVVVPPGI